MWATRDAGLTMSDWWMWQVKIDFLLTSRKEFCNQDPIHKGVQKTDIVLDCLTEFGFRQVVINKSNSCISFCLNLSPLVSPSALSEANSRSKRWESGLNLFCSVLVVCLSRTALQSSWQTSIYFMTKGLVLSVGDRLGSKSGLSARLSDPPARSLSAFRVSLMSPLHERFSFKQNSRLPSKRSVADSIDMWTQKWSCFWSFWQTHTSPSQVAYPHHGNDKWLRIIWVHLFILPSVLWHTYTSFPFLFLSAKFLVGFENEHLPL